MFLERRKGKLFIDSPRYLYLYIIYLLEKSVCLRVSPLTLKHTLFFSNKKKNFAPAPAYIINIGIWCF